MRAYIYIYIQFNVKLSLHLLYIVIGGCVKDQGEFHSKKEKKHQGFYKFKGDEKRKGIKKGRCARVWGRYGCEDKHDDAWAVRARRAAQVGSAHVKFCRAWR